MNTERPGTMVLGDPIPSLVALRAAPDVHDSGDPRSTADVRAVVIGVDLSHAKSAGDVRRALGSHAALCVALGERLPRLAHVIFVTGGSSHAVEVSVREAGEQSSRRIHAQLEQSCATYVAVTVVVADSCAEPQLLALRIVQRARRAPGIDASVALTWNEMAADSVGLAGANHYL